jgi:hypothetical protein
MPPVAAPRSFGPLQCESTLARSAALFVFGIDDQGKLVVVAL